MSFEHIFFYPPQTQGGSVVLGSFVQNMPETWQDFVELGAASDSKDHR